MKLVDAAAERELKHVRELLDKLRLDLVAARTRQDHDPNVKGNGYEDDVLDLLQDAASVYGLTPVKTGTEIGESLGCSDIAAILPMHPRELQADLDDPPDWY